MLKSVDASISSNLPKSTVKDEFPESYKIYIDNIKRVYPNATFKAVYTGLDWNTVVKHESYAVNNRISLIPSSYSSVWKKDGKNTYIDGNFVIASKSAVAYVLDPRNMLYDKYVFQFEGLTYNNNISKDVVEKVISSTPMVGTYEKKYKKSGKWVDMDMTYAEIIDKVGSEKGVSSVYIASLIMQETSGDIINNGSINGSNGTYPGVYNFFNIKATPNSDGTGSVVNGLKYANSQGWITPYLSISGGIESIKKNYIIYGQDTIYFQKFDVNNPYGNAKALMAYQYQTNIVAPRLESVISYNAYKKLNLLNTQFTFYIPVYNNMPDDPAPYPSSDSAKFVNDNTKVYLDDEVKNGTDTFNIRSSASSELDNIIYTLNETKEGANNRTIMKRTKKGDGYDFDYVEFEVSGKTVKGYVWNEYVKEYNYTKVEKVELNVESLNLQVEETFDLVQTITPTDAKYKTVTWSSSNDKVASVNSGKVAALSEGEAIITVTTDDGAKTATCNVTVTKKEAVISTDKEEYTVEVGKIVTPVIILKNIDDYTLSVENNNIAHINGKSVEGLVEGETQVTIKGIDSTVSKVVKLTVLPKPNESCVIDENINIKDEVVTNIMPNTLVSTLKQKFTLTNLTLEIKDVNNNILDENSKVGTGTTLNIKKEDGSIYNSYTVVISGDVTGDGNINSADLLKIVKYLKGINTLNESAADVTKDNKINSADLLKIVKYLKGTSTIDFS